MRRSALFLLTLHVAAGSVLAQTAPSVPSWQTAAPGTLEVRTGDHVATYPVNQPAAVTQQPSAPVSETLSNFDPQSATE